MRPDDGGGMPSGSTQPSPGAPHAANVVVVGAGFSGLAAAYELVRRGYRPIVLEAETEVGGLAASFRIDGTRIERFYHHWFTSDDDVTRLIRDVGMEDRVTWRSTR